MYGERGEDFARIRLHGGWKGAFKNALQLREIDEEVATGSDATPSDATPSDATPNDAVEDDEVKWKLVNVGEAKNTDFTVDVTMGNEMSDDEFREAAEAAGLTAPEGAVEIDPVWLAEEGNFDSRLDLEDGEPYELNENKLGKTTDFYAGWFFKSRVTSTQLEGGSVSAAAPGGVEIEVGDLEEEKPFEEISEALETEGLELADISDTLQLDISLVEESEPLKKGDAVGVRIVLPQEFAERVTDTKNGTVEFSMDSFSPVVLAITGDAGDA